MDTSSTISEYLLALNGSPKFGPQVVYQKTLEGEAAQYSKKALPVHEKLVQYLQSQGIAKLYGHQQQAIEYIQAGKDIIVATPTASGKSMIYNLPVIDMLLSKPNGTALYLFPLKALAQDQLRVFSLFEQLLPEKKKRYGAIYDGDTSPYQRRRIREDHLPVIMTNPEMVHLSFLPYHGNWVHFFQNLTYIVIDEVHTYRGVLGSHMSWVLTRLSRIAAAYGATPQFILLSATIGNPGELAENLLGRKVKVISSSGAPQNKKHIALINPWDSAAYTASQLLEAAVKRGLRTIVYTQSRKMTELITLWTTPKLGELSDKLSSYRAGFLPEERREIEHNLSEGTLLGVISTSALELGIDIGDLDLCILVGYPGSIMSTYQRGGRVGRGDKESAIVLIGQEDALDQYFMRQPEDFFSRTVENAVLNPFNRAIAKQHLHCVAAENVIGIDDDILSSSKVVEFLQEMVHEGILLQSADGTAWHGTRKYPQRDVNLRGGATQLSIINQKSGEIIGEIDSTRALKECHPGAVYLHRLKTWLVQKLELENREVLVQPKKPSFFTRPMSSKTTEILQVFETGTSFRAKISLGKLKVTEQVSGYQKRNNSTQKLIASYSLDLPKQTIETEGLWLEIPPDIRESLEKEQYHFMGAIHALEHAMISLFPLLVLCDRNDIGGISCPVHEQTNEATIFVYDGYNGGIGLAEGAYAKMDKLLRETFELIKRCGCENGCPSCVHSPKCGSGNRPIDKRSCLKLLELLLGDHEHKAYHFARSTIVATNGKMATNFDQTSDTQPQTGLAVLPERYGVFDLETIRSADEVGGWHRADKMGVSVGVIWDSELEGSVTYLEHEMAALVAHLQRLDLVIGFNCKRFDYQVLSGYTTVNCNSFPTLDLLEEISAQLGYRLSLDRVAEHTLGAKKTADGLQALRWYKEGKIDLIQKYCKKDVELTRDLLHFGLEKGHFIFKNKAGKLVRLPLKLNASIQKITSL